MAEENELESTELNKDRKTNVYSGLTENSAKRDYNMPENIDQNKSSTNSCSFDDSGVQSSSIGLDLSSFRSKLEEEFNHSLNRLAMMTFDFSDFSETFEPENAKRVGEVNLKETNLEHCFDCNDGQQICSGGIESNSQKLPASEQPACSRDTNGSPHRTSIPSYPGNNVESVYLSQRCEELQEHIKDILQSKHLGEENASILITNVRDVVQLFVNCTDAARNFNLLFPSWEKSRHRNIFELERLQELLNQLNFSNSNFESLSAKKGNCCLIGMAQPTVESNKEAKHDTGKLITENIKKCLNSTLVEMKKDKATLQVFQRWFEQSALLVKSMDKILDFNTFMHLLKSTRKLEKYFSDRDENETNFLEKFTESVLPVFLEYNASKTHIVDLELLVTILYSNRRLLKSLINLHSVYPQFSEAIAMTAKITLEVAKIIRPNCEDDTMSTFVSLMARPGNGIFGGAGVAFEVLLIIATFFHSHHSSQARHSQAIPPVLKILKEEVNALFLLHKVIRKNILQIS